MNGSAATIILVEDDPGFRAQYESILKREPGFRVHAAAGGDAALALAREIKPDCVVTDLQMPGMSGFDLCRQLKNDPELSATMVLVVTGTTDVQKKVEGLGLGVDDYVTKPVGAAELIARVRVLLRTRRLHDQLRADKVEVEQLHAALGQSFDQLLSLLIYMIDLRRPGAADRGRQLATSALQLAARFEVPAEFLRDLELAALLHEIGVAVDPAGKPGNSAWVNGAQWRSMVVAKEALDQVERLRPVAELIGMIMENWDGSGFPERLQRGQIPLRARILRILIDYFAAIAPRPSGSRLRSEEVIEALRMHSGTWYDPVIVGQLEIILSERPALSETRGRLRVPLPELEVGMVLVEDLCTSSGVKLLSAGSTITARSLEMILRRDVGDPIINGACVYPACT
jgi:putative two-component system response regulator